MSDTQTLSLRDLAEDANLRIGAAVHLPTFAPDNEVHGDLLELLNEAASDLGWPEFEDEDDAAEFLSDNIGSGDGGWILEANSPVPFKFHANGAALSWGHYRLRYVYGDTYREAVAAAAVWARKMWDDERKHAAALLDQEQTA